MPTIELSHVTKRWGGYYGVDDLSMAIDDNAFVTLLGPSGCGKTTTLRMIAGLETPTKGRITIGDQVVFDSARGIDVPANKRHVGFLFQNYALWPNMTIYQNISFGLSNVHEELPVVDDDAVNAAGMVRALKQPHGIRDILSGSLDKKGKIDDSRALAALIDAYQLSAAAAREVLELRLLKKDDTEAGVVDKCNHYESILEKVREKHAAAGEELNDRYEVVGSDGMVRMAKRKLSKQEIDLRVRAVARTVKIGAFMNRYPSELSGGQQQRVAIARTLAPAPRVLFMDEPLSNLDAKLRLEMRSELQRLHIETGSTFVYVTHDQGEAITLGTRICLLDNAVLQQYDAPRDVYQRPANLFVADFVGNPSINFIDAQGAQTETGSVSLSALDGLDLSFIPTGELDLDAWFSHEDEFDAEAAEAMRVKYEAKGEPSKENQESSFHYRVALADEPEGVQPDDTCSDEDFVVGVRPEFVTIGEDGAFEGEVYSSMPTGLETTIRLRIGRFLLTSVLFGDATYRIGEYVRFGFRDDAVILFSRKNGRRIAHGSLRRK